MYFRAKRSKDYHYLQIVESYRDKGRVRQRVLATLGRLDELVETSQLDDLLRSGLRFSQKLTLLDAHEEGKTQPVRIVSLGPDLVFGRLWKDLGIDRAIQRSLEGS